MSEHAYETVKVPEKYHPLLRRLQRGTWRVDELQWLLRQHPNLPPIIEGLVRQKLAELRSQEESPIGGTDS
jgi:hypothetical protein